MLISSVTGTSNSKIFWTSVVASAIRTYMSMLHISPGFPRLCTNFSCCNVRGVEVQLSRNWKRSYDWLTASERKWSLSWLSRRSWGGTRDKPKNILVPRATIILTCGRDRELWPEQHTGQTSGMRKWVHFLAAAGQFPAQKFKENMGTSPCHAKFTKKKLKRS